MSLHQKPHFLFSRKKGLQWGTEWDLMVYVVLPLLSRDMRSINPHGRPHFLIKKKKALQRELNGDNFWTISGVDTSLF